ncbi:MAG: HPr family phosphocarrier protein [Kiritimatiellales bacterium]
MAAEKEMIREIEVLNAYGIHARPAALLVKAAGKYRSDVFIGHDASDEVSAKSIMGLLTIEGHKGTKLRIRTCGVDAEAAMNEIIKLFETKFLED